MAEATGRPTWQQSMLRIKDPKVSVTHYEKLYGMTLLDKLDFPDMKFSLYFMASLPPGEKAPPVGTPKAHKYLWNYPGTTLELTHNHGTEMKEGKSYHPGNGKGDGFGHIAFACDDVYKACEELEKKGVSFKKKPNEGRMKGLAFAYDPDMYWVEIIKRGTPLEEKGYAKFTLKQTMLRVKDPKPTLEFYSKYFGMTCVSSKVFSDFSLYFLACVKPGAKEADPDKPVLELTHNHGTEEDDNFKHKTGNEEGKKGFGHLGFLVDDVYSKCKELEAAGFKLKKAPDAGSMKGLAFALDPDGYWVEIIKRGGYDKESTPYYFEPKK